MSGRVGRGYEIMLREWVRGIIGIEEWRDLREDSYSRKIDRQVRTTMEPNVSYLNLLAIENPTAALAKINTALEAGEGSYEKAIEFLDKPADEEQISSRTLRRIHQKLLGGAKPAASARDEMKPDEDEEGDEERERPDGFDKDDEKRKRGNMAR